MTKTTEMKTAEASGAKDGFRKAVANAIVSGVNADELRSCLDQVVTALAMAGEAGLTLAAASGGPVSPGRAWRRVTPRLLSEVAALYRQELAAGRPPTFAVAYRYEVSHGTAARWVRSARKEGLLGASVGPVAGEGPRGEFNKDDLLESARTSGQD